MKRYGNLFPSIVNIDNIVLASNNARKGKSSYRQIVKFEKDLENNLFQIQQSLVDKTFSTGKYRERIILEPKKRTIYILPYEDRIVQHALMNIIAPIFESSFIHTSYSCIKNRGVHKGGRKAMEYVRKYKYCLKCDISKFYPSIDHAILKQKIRKKIKCKDTLWLVDNIIDSFEGGKNTPIGNYTSQWFGNIYMNDLDHYVIRELKVPSYIRYCDDFLLFSDDKKHLQHCLNVIREICKEDLKLKLSKEEIFPVSRGVDFLGYRYFPTGYILVRKSTVKRVKKRISKIKSYLLTHKVTASIRSQVESTLGWINHANSYNLKKSLGLYDLQLIYKDIKHDL